MYKYPNNNSSCMEKSMKIMARREANNQNTLTLCGGRHGYRESYPQRSCTLDTCKHIKSDNTKLIPQTNHGTSKSIYDKWNKKADTFGDYKSVMNETAVNSSNSYEYFTRPIMPSMVPKIHNIEIPCHSFHPETQRAAEQSDTPPSRSKKYGNIGTQTDYRDSETQTSPWEPPFTIRPGHDPEVLMLANLTWNNGLPAGMHEIEIIKRIRMKRAWEEILPPMDTPENIKIRTSIITALEVDEWAFRESEIQYIMDLKLKLMKDMMEKRELERNKKVQARYARLKNHLQQRKTKEIRDIRHNLVRELRKLYKRHNEKRQSNKRDIISQHADPTSAIYAPQMRFGKSLQGRHEILQKGLLKERFIDTAEKQNTLPSWLPTYEELKAIRPKPKPTDLCIRETRWTEEKLRKLHADLKAIRLNIKPVETLSLMKRKYKPPPLPSTPRREGGQDADDLLDQSSLLIQKIVRGRAIQCMMYEGRDRCRELIEELQSTHALEEHDKKERQHENAEVIQLQRQRYDREMHSDRVSELLNSLEGASTAGMLDYLSKELIRLHDERAAHAFALLAERERCKREAAEAGRRQLERNRRREFDEMFRQIVKVNQDSVECYLEDIIKEGIEWASDQEATEYILQLSEKVDQAAEYAKENATDLAEEELVADMIYNFVLPDVEKQNARKRIREKQQGYLQNAHAEIYNEILSLPPVEVATQDGIDETYYGEEYEELAPHTESLDKISAESEIKEATDAVEKMTEHTEEIQLILDELISKVISTESEEIVQSLLNDIITEVVECEGSSSDISYCSSSISDESFD